MARTDWKYNDIVTETDMNQLGQQVNAAGEGLVILEEQIEETGQNARVYTDQQIALVTATGIPKLVTYPYVLTATQNGQTDFEIPLTIFEKDTDTVIVVQNSTVLSTDRFSIVEPRTVRLAEGANIGTELFIQVWKNVPIGTDGAISAAVLADGTVTEDKMANEMKKNIPGGVAAYDAVMAIEEGFNEHLAKSATDASAGHIELATAAETSTGTDTTRAVHPAGLKSVLDSRITVTSVAGKIGTVTLVKADVGLGNVDNIQQMPIAGGTFTGVAMAQNNTAYTTKQIRNITLSTAAATGGSNGDIWIKYS